MKCFNVSTKNLAEVLSYIEVYLSEDDKETSYKVMLSCDEILTNQITHSDFGSKKPKIELCISIKNTKEVSLIFRDNAQMFNPLKQVDPDRTTSLDTTQLGGLGIFLVKQYAKRLSYVYQDGYNILKVTI